LFAEEVILSEEKTSTEDKIKIIEGNFYGTMKTTYTTTNIIIIILLLLLLLLQSFIRQ